MKAWQPLKRENGFTLLEVMISLVILSVGLLGASRLTISVVKGNAFGKRMMVAATLAQAKLEEIKKLPYSSPDLNPGTITESNLGVNGGGGSYQRVTQVTANSPTNNTKKIKVTVSWDNPQNHSVSMYTIVAL